MAIPPHGFAPLPLDFLRGLADDDPERIPARRHPRPCRQVDEPCLLHVRAYEDLLVGACQRLPDVHGLGRKTAV